MALTKPTGAWTYEDLASLPDDGHRYEIIEGELYEMSGPSFDHAAVVANLITMLIPMISGLRGRWFTAPLDVFFTGANPVQPDLLAVLPGWQGDTSKRGIEGAPDLVVEVLSPSNRQHDVVRKRALFAAGGVREYWIVDPEAGTLEILQLSGKRFQQADFCSGEAIAASPLLGPLPIPTAELFAGIEP